MNVEYELQCTCGSQVTCSEHAAGTTITCPCGATIQVPALRVLRTLKEKERVVPAAQAARKKVSLRKRLAFSTLMFLLSLGPILALSEVGYRWMHSIPLTGGILSENDLRLLDTPANRFYTSLYRRSDNPVLFYELRPHVEIGPYRVNSNGFRDREYAIEKPAGVFRIAVLGDSIAWGHMLPLEATFAKQLEQALNSQLDQQFEVLNFGVSGYSTQQEVELYRTRVKRFDPDLVIVCYCLNDFMASSVEAGALQRAYYDVFSKSYLLEHWQRYFRGMAHNTLGQEEQESQAHFDLRQQFRVLDDECPSKSLVVIFPNLADFDNYFLQYEHDRVRRATQYLDYELLDLLDVYRHHDADQLVVRHDDRTHPNALGNKLAAEAAMELLLQKQMLARPRHLMNLAPSNGPGPDGKN